MGRIPPARSASGDEKTPVALTHEKIKHGCRSVCKAILGIVSVREEHHCTTVSSALKCNLTGILPSEATLEGAGQYIRLFAGPVKIVNFDLQNQN